MIALELTLDANLTNTVGLVLAFVVGTLACTRVVRLFVDDDWPPSRFVREWYVRHVPMAWHNLAECPWCFAPYVVVVDLIWAWTTGLHWTWWFGNLWAAVSWLVGFLNVRDLPEDQR